MRIVKSGILYWVVGGVILMTVMVAEGGVAGAQPLHRGSGTITCDDVSVTITFHPPMKATNGSSVRGRVKLLGSGCTGGSPTPTKLVGKGKASDFTFDMCNFDQTTVSASLSLRVTYPGQDLAPSRLAGNWSGYAVPGAFDTGFYGQVTGSFPSASESSELDFSPSEYDGSCATGISSLTAGAIVGSF